MSVQLFTLFSLVLGACFSFLTHCLCSLAVICLLEVPSDALMTIPQLVTPNINSVPPAPLLSPSSSSSIPFVLSLSVTNHQTLLCTALPLVPPLLSCCHVSQELLSTNCFWSLFSPLLSILILLEGFFSLFLLFSFFNAFPPLNSCVSFAFTISLTGKPFNCFFSRATLVRHELYLRCSVPPHPLT